MPCLFQTGRIPCSTSPKETNPSRLFDRFAAILVVVADWCAGSDHSLKRQQDSCTFDKVQMTVGPLIELSGTQVFATPANGPELRTAKDAVDLMSAASEYHATFIVIPVERLGDDFFDLRTCIAGE